MIALLALATTTLTLKIDRLGDGFRVPHTPVLMPTGDLTLEAWVKPQRNPSAGPFKYIVSKNYSGSGYALLLIGKDEMCRFQFEANDVIAHEVHMNVLAGEWWHVAGVLVSGRELRLYVNGVLVGHKPTKATLISNDLPLYLGTSPWDTFLGNIDDVMIWKTARTQEQIKRDSKVAPRFDDPGLVAYWDFERVRKGLLYDRTHHTRPGEPIGKPLTARERR